MSATHSPPDRLSPRSEVVLKASAAALKARIDGDVDDDPRGQLGIDRLPTEQLEEELHHNAWNDEFWEG